MALTSEQEQSFDLFKRGNSFFISGKAGCGKTFLLLNKFVPWARETGLEIAVTAMTGHAALLLEGKTIHSHLGLGLGDESFDVMLKRIRFNKVISKRWKTLDCLIVDEVSMMSPDLLEKVDRLAKTLRYNSQPMGGIQTIFSGDFLQLPPVNKNANDRRFCFESPVWDHIFKEKVELVQIMRQSDAKFQKMLNEIRVGKCSEETQKILESRIGADISNDMGIEPTRLYTRNIDIEHINKTHLLQLKQALKTYPALYEVGYDRLEIDCKSAKKVTDKLKASLDKNTTCASVLELCEGAQVMLLTNMDFENELVNGSRGIVTGFKGELPIVKFLNGQERCIDRQAWTLREESVSVTRKQIPLKLAYAITIHKSQGCSLDCAEVDIGRSIFDAGQSYVALSRVRSLEGLRIISFAPERIFAHSKVLEFMNLQTKAQELIEQSNLVKLG